MYANKSVFVSLPDSYAALRPALPLPPLLLTLSATVGVPDTVTLELKATAMRTVELIPCVASPPGEETDTTSAACTGDGASTAIDEPQRDPADPGSGSVWLAGLPALSPMPPAGTSESTCA